MDVLRPLHEPAEPGAPSFDNAAPSPRQVVYDKARSASLTTALQATQHNAPAHPAVSPRAYGSVGPAFSPAWGSHGQVLPPLLGHQQHQPQHAQQQQHHHHGHVPPPPSSSSSSPPLLSNLYRRHTSADIRSQRWGLQPPAPAPPPLPQVHVHSPYEPDVAPAPGSSPSHHVAGGAQHIQDSFAHFAFPLSPGPPRRAHLGTPPPAAGSEPPPAMGDPHVNNNNSSGSSLAPPLAVPRVSFANSAGVDTPGPPTRRSSMTSNLQSLLNPAASQSADADNNNNTAAAAAAAGGSNGSGGNGGAGAGGAEVRKRKRMR